MKAAFHCVWIQGASFLPSRLRRSVASWRSALPRRWTTTVWDGQMAAARWSEYRNLEGLCRHHANRADIVRALILRDIGGLYCDIDSNPVNLPVLLRFIRANPTMLVLGNSPPHIANSLAWSARPGHSFFADLIDHVQRHKDRLGWQNCSESTGPRAWWTVFKSQRYDVSLVSERRAFTRSWTERRSRNPDAFVNHHYSASWVDES